MDHNSIIDRDTFEVTIHAEDHPKVFVCDKPIAPIVALLNKKGYKTIASCSGHYRIEFYEYLDEDIKYLDEYKQDDRIIIKKVKDKTFDYFKEVDMTHMYILFDKDYYFTTLPLDFNVRKNDNRLMIDYTINYYDEKHNHKSISMVMREIDNKCKLLEEWVKELPNLNERND